MISSTTVRVNYSETDQMGVVYHANYLIWFDRARTELMRDTGLTYRALEQQGCTSRCRRSRFAIAPRRVTMISCAFGAGCASCFHAG